MLVINLLLLWAFWFGKEKRTLPRAYAGNCPDGRHARDANRPHAQIGKAAHCVNAHEPSAPLPLRFLRDYFSIFFGTCQGFSRKRLAFCRFFLYRAESNSIFRVFRVGKQWDIGTIRFGNFTHAFRSQNTTFLRIVRE